MDTQHYAVMIVDVPLRTLCHVVAIVVCHVSQDMLTIAENAKNDQNAILQIQRMILYA